MEIKRFVLGSYENNSYVLRSNDQAKECLIIDTGLEVDELLEYLGSEKLSPAALVFTHGHADHTRGVGELKERYPEMKVCVHKYDAQMLGDSILNMSAWAGMDFETGPADVVIEGEGMIEYAGIKLDVFLVPGHTEGSICLYSKADNAVFVGDVLFAGSIGRTDFPGFNPQEKHEQLIEGIKKRLLILPGETAVYPGHGMRTTIAREKRYNPFLQKV